MADYTYEPLSAQLGEIRLMRVYRSATSSAEIECDIFRAVPGDGQRYDALSYHWDAEDKHKHILVHGKRFAITASFHAALARLRGSGGPQHGNELILWVDAVCINQADIAEKSQQVAQMHHIYRHAENVISWLGSGKDEGERALSWIQDIGKRASQLGLRSMSESAIQSLLDITESFWFHEKSLPGVSGTNMSPLQRMRKWCRRPETPDGGKMLLLCDIYQSMFDDGEDSPSLRYPVESLLRCDYWQRAWITQEVYNARNIKFVCGRETADEESLMLSIEILRIFQESRLTKTGQPIFPEFGTFQANTILKIRRSGINGVALPLIYLLRHFRKSQSSLMVDKIFALLNIAADVDKMGIIPDYAMETQECFVQVAQALLRNGYTEILSLCNSIDRVPGLPSWAPDWGYLSAQAFLTQRAMLATGVTELQPNFKAGTELLVPSKRGFSVQGHKLTLSGVRLGQIRKLGARFDASCPSQWLGDILACSPLKPENVRRRIYNACAIAVADQEIRQGKNKPRIQPHRLDRIAYSIPLALPTNLLDHLRDQGFADYSEQLFKVARNRRPIAVDNKYVGIAPEHTEPGDEVFIVAGAQVPYIFRQIAETSFFELIGEAYVHGVMDGEITVGKSSQLQQITVV